MGIEPTQDLLGPTLVLKTRSATGRQSPPHLEYHSVLTSLCNKPKHRPLHPDYHRHPPAGTLGMSGVAGSVGANPRDGTNHGISGSRPTTRRAEGLRRRAGTCLFPYLTLPRPALQGNPGRDAPFRHEPRHASGDTANSRSARKAGITGAVNLSPSSTPKSEIS